MAQTQPQQPQAPDASLCIAAPETVCERPQETDLGVGAVLQAEQQYLRDLAAVEALGDRCFFDAMGEVIARRLGA